MDPSNDPPKKEETIRLRHDLRNELNAMITAGRCLERCEDIPPQFQEFVAAIRSSGDRSIALLDRLWPRR